MITRRDVFVALALTACGGDSVNEVTTMAELCEDQFLTCSDSAAGVDEYVATCAQDWEDIATSYADLGCEAEFSDLRACWIEGWNGLSGASDKCEGGTGELRFDACSALETMLENCSAG